MLSRTLHRHGGRTPRRKRQPLVLTALGLALIVGFFLLLPKPPPRLRSVALNDDQLRLVVSASRLPPSVGNHPDPAAVALGRSLFFATSLNPGDDRSCASCHQSSHAYGSGIVSGGSFEAGSGQRTVTDLSAPSSHQWYGQDGRSDSLAGACLAALEDPDAMASSRLSVVTEVRRRYLAAYEAAFGPWPSQLDQSLPAAGRPPLSQVKLPMDVAVQGLASLGSFPLLEEILNKAAEEHATPALELARRAVRQAPLPPAWPLAFASLSAPLQDSVNRVYANLGTALAAYTAGLVTSDTPYDRFAARLLQGKSSEEALAQDFSRSELDGLKLFHGPGRCASCHSGPHFSDGRFHNLGLAQRGSTISIGRASGLQQAAVDPFNCRSVYRTPPSEAEASACTDRLTPAVPGDLGAFKTPSLRNVAGRSPYMHDGRFAELSDVLAYYNDLRDLPAVGHRDPGLVPLDFTPEELTAISHFLSSLSAPAYDLNRPQTASSKP